MRVNAALWYRVVLISGMVALTAVAWLVVGGQAGAIVWVMGFLLIWAATRFANRYFSGFLLGDDRAPEFGSWPESGEDETPRPRDSE